MWRTLITVAMAGFLLSGTVRADLEIGTYAPDLEAGDWLNTDGQSISLSELRGMVVVATRDAVLVIPKERAQEVRRIVAELKARGAAQL